MHLSIALRPPCMPCIEKHPWLWLGQLVHCSHVQYNSKAPDEFSHPPQGHYAPLKWNIRRCHNVFTKLGGTWLCGHLFSPPANRNEPDQANARWWLCIHWVSAHVHVCTHNLSTPSPQASKVGNYWENESSRSILCRRGSICCLFAAW